jgi:arylsulfatase A-like enzyme
MLGSHGERLKRKPWEESIRVPGLLRYPARVKGGRRLDALLSHVDLAPTLLTLCEIPIPPEMQGTDLSNVILGKSDRGPDSAYFQIFVPFAGDGTPHPWRGVRTSRSMYARTQSGPWLLYDLERDPYERKNLADDPAEAPLREAMEAKLADWMKRMGDSWAFNSTAPVEDKGRLYRFGAFSTIEEYLQWAAKHPDLAPRD